MGRCIYIVKHKETERKKNRKGLREKKGRERSNEKTELELEDREPQRAEASPAQSPVGRGGRPGDPTKVYDL